jgi:hypothetical protein
MFPAMVCLLVSRLINRPWLETHPPRLLYGNRRLRLQFKTIKAEVDVFPVVVCLLVSRLADRPWLETHPPWLLYRNWRLRLQFESAPDDGQSVARNMLSRVYMTKQ